MDQFLHIYIKELLMQKEFALKSYESFSITQQIPRECLYHIHHFLIHTSNIIKIIFPKDTPKNFSNPCIQHRAKLLREKLDVSKKDFDINQIGVRNDFEHYDTRIDYWVQNSENHSYCDINIMPEDAVTGINPIDMFRNLDPTTHILSFCGKQYDLKYLKEFLEKKINENIT